jgi:hypothetical protein
MKEYCFALSTMAQFIIREKCGLIRGTGILPVHSRLHGLEAHATFCPVKF